MTREFYIDLRKTPSWNDLPMIYTLQQCPSPIWISFVSEGIKQNRKRKRKGKKKTAIRIIKRPTVLLSKNIPPNNQDHKSFNPPTYPVPSIYQPNSPLFTPIPIHHFLLPDTAALIIIIIIITAIINAKDNNINNNPCPHSAVPMLT